MFYLLIANYLSYNYNLIMGDDIFKRTIECIPELFDIQLQLDPLGAGIFEPLGKIIDFDDAYIFFLNPDNISIKYMFSKERVHNLGDVFPINSEIKSDLFSPENKILNYENELVKLLGLHNFNSFLISKLVIRETVFGFILMSKKEKDFYNDCDTKVASAAGAIIAYKIKDIELSEIFKAQLKALQEGIVQTKLAYKTIKEQNVKIMEADKIKNEFLANISHELRTPLNAIIGFSEMLSTKFFGDLNIKQTEYVEDIRVSGVHLLGMINELLDISKIEANAMSLNKSEFLLSQVVDEVVNVVNPLTAKKFISISKNISKERYVLADFQKCKQILYNLLSNAINFSPPKSEIDVEVIFSNDFFTILVRDNGIGIAQKDQTRIFEKFVQLENAYTKTQSSTGLGLTITKELVEMHKGEISVESELGKGTTFVVKIPSS